MSYESNLLDLIQSSKTLVRYAPLLLGGSAGVSGGVGGNPAGFIGRLPQSRSTYDMSEAETLDTPFSGASLVDNLNHIRYRIKQMESGVFPTGIYPAGSFTVYNDGELAGSGITILDIGDGMSLEIDGDRAILTATVSGATASGISAISVYENGTLLSEDVIGIDFIGSVSVSIESNIAKVTVVASGASSEAGDITTDTTNFDGILTASDSNVQTALETIDDHNHTVDSLSNVTITSLLDGQSLTWDADTNQWINTTISGGSSVDSQVSSMDMVTVYADAEDAHTNNNVWEDIQGMSAEFITTVSGTYALPIFTARMDINSTSWAHYYVRFLLDNTIVSETWRESKDAAIVDNTNYVLTYHTVFEDLSIGTHTIKVQWSTASNLDVVYYDRRLSVLYQSNSVTPSGNVLASGVINNTTNFDNHLSASDITVQQALETLDEHNHTVDGLSNVVISEVQDGQALAWDAETSKWTNTTVSGGGSGTMTEILGSEHITVVSGTSATPTILFNEDGLQLPANDITITDAGEHYDSTDVEGALQELGVHNHNLSNLTDVNLSSLQDAQILAWDTTTSKWINTTISGSSTPSVGNGSTILHCFIDGYLAVASGVCSFIAPTTMTISGVFMSCQFAGDSGSTIIDVIKNGTTIFTTPSNRPTLVYTETYASGIPDIIELVAGDIINIDIPQIAEDAYGLSISINLMGESSSSTSSLEIVDENSTSYEGVTKITISGATITGTPDNLNITIANEGSGNVLEDTAWNAKGDILVGSGIDTGLILGVGVNGSHLEADSTQDSGLLWMGRKGCHVYNSGNISINTSSWTELTWDSETFDDDAIHSTVTNAGRLTAKTAGLYIIIGAVIFAANGTGSRLAKILKNAEATEIGIFSIPAITTGSVNSRIQVITMSIMAVNDYVILQAYQNSGGALNVAANSFLSMIRIA